MMDKTDKTDKTDKLLLLLFGVAMFLGTVFLGTLVGRYVIIHALIPSSSMESTLNQGDMLFINRLSYRFNEPRRFDIIVFDDPSKGNGFVIKRVIGLPGERLEIIHGSVYINNRQTPLREDFITEAYWGNHGPFYIPEGKYFVLGDNRNNSLDSRFWYDAFVRERHIEGRLAVRYFPNIQIFRGGR